MKGGRVITVRPDKAEAKKIDTAMKHYGVGHATVALIKAATDVPGLTRELAKRTEELEDAQYQMNELKRLLIKRKQIESEIAEMLG